jgi:hypothetical protein
MKQRVMALTILWTFLATGIITSCFYGSVSANPYYTSPSLSISCPAQNTTYRSNVPLAVSITTDVHILNNDVERATRLFYSLDGRPEVAVAVNYPDPEVFSSSIMASDLLKGLNDGMHKLVVFGSTNRNASFSSSVSFNVNSSAPISDNSLPKITMLSPENKTYSTIYVHLTVAVSKPFSWIRYSINNQANITTKIGDLTIYLKPEFVKNYSPAKIAYTPFNLTVYAVDGNGNIGTSDTIDFALDDIANITPTPTAPELSWLIILPLLFAIFSVALILRHRKTVKE